MRIIKNRKIIGNQWRLERDAGDGDATGNSTAGVNGDDGVKTAAKVNAATAGKATGKVNATGDSTVGVNAGRKVNPATAGKAAGKVNATGDSTAAAEVNTTVGDHTILPLARWRKLRATRALKGKAIGVTLRPADSVKEIAADLDDIALIALDFGAFNEGRGYTQATELRRQYRFPGEIRALGAHRDNLPLMERCGIDAYQLAEGEDLKQALDAFDEITAYYPVNA